MTTMIDGWKMKLSSAWKSAFARIELREIAETYARDLSHELYTECYYEYIRLNILREFRIPARKEKRKSLGLDRDAIPEARVGWRVLFYRKKRLVAVGRVRKFVPRTDRSRSDLVIVRLFKELDVEELMQENRDKLTVKLRVKLDNPNLWNGCYNMPTLESYMKRLKLSQAAINLLFGNLEQIDKSTSALVRDPPAKLTDLLLPQKFKPFSFKFNEEQRRCFLDAIGKQISIINGVVGSGKSHIAAYIAYCLAYGLQQKILICSNYSGSMELISKLLIDRQKFVDLDDQLTVIKVNNFRRNYEMKNPKNWRADLGKSKSGNLASLVELAIRKRLYKRIDKVADLCRWGFTKYYGKKFELRHIFVARLLERSRKIVSQYTINETERNLIKKADIVCCDFKNFDRAYMKDYHYDVVIIDDSHLVSNVDLLKTILNPNLKQIILLGDEKPIPFENVTTHDDDGSHRDHLIEMGYLFAEITDNYDGIAKKLTQRYRGHERLMEFVNEKFYDMTLDSSANSNNNIGICRALGYFEDWPLTNESMIEIISTDNDCDAMGQMIDNLILHLTEKLTFSKSSITILTTYETSIRKVECEGIQIKTVLDSVGLESDIVILLCEQYSEKSTRMSWELDPDFTRNPKALQIALTRAKLGLFVVGQDRFIQNSSNSTETSDNFCPEWCEFVSRYYRTGNQLCSFIRADEFDYSIKLSISLLDRKTKDGTERDFKLLCVQGSIG